MAMAMASALPLVLPRSASASFHFCPLALPLRPVAFSAPTAYHSRKAGRLEPLRAASCCNGSSAAAGTAGGGGAVTQDWRLLAW
jgi:hypothetical protein